MSTSTKSSMIVMAIPFLAWDSPDTNSFLFSIYSSFFQCIGITQHKGSQESNAGLCFFASPTFATCRDHFALLTSCRCRIPSFGCFVAFLLAACLPLESETNGIILAKPVRDEQKDHVP